MLVRGDLPNLVLTKNLGTLVGLEGCLSGNKPADATGAGRREVGPCAALARDEAGAGRLRPGHVHQLGGRGGPEPAVEPRSQATAAEAEKAATAARKLSRGRGQSQAQQDKAGRGRRAQVVYGKLLRDLLQITLRYGLGLTGVPTLNDPNFVSALVFDPARGARTPKARFAYLFPSDELGAHPGAAEAGPHRRASGATRSSRSARRSRCPSGSSTRRATRVTGAPVVLDDLADGARRLGAAAAGRRAAW